MTKLILVLSCVLCACGSGVGYPGDGDDANTDVPDFAKQPDLAVSSCPATQPVTAAPNPGCTAEGASCTYGTELCVCNGAAWYCRSTTCPSSASATGSCSPNGLDCIYGPESELFCVNGSWEATSGLPDMATD